MHILIAFGTTEGQTKKIASHILEKIHDLSHSADLYDCSQPLGDRHIASYDAIIIAASVHHQRHQDTAVTFAMGFQQQLAMCPSAFVSVSLAAAFDDDMKDASSYVERFLKDVRWQPTQVYLAEGALRFTEYDYFKAQIIRHVVMAGRDLPNVGDNCELTDWNALDRFTTDFVEAINL